MGNAWCTQRQRVMDTLNNPISSEEYSQDMVDWDEIFRNRELEREKERDMNRCNEILIAYNKNSFFEIPLCDSHYISDRGFDKDWYIKLTEIFAKIGPLFDKNHAWKNRIWVKSNYQKYIEISIRVNLLRAQSYSTWNSLKINIYGSCTIVPL